MKTILSLILFPLLSFNLIAGNPENHPDKYCAKIKDGKKTIVHGGSPITSEVTLANGTRIQVDGTIVKTDGNKTVLQEGECISKDGTIAMENDKKK